jgi:hypothetical protein
LRPTISSASSSVVVSAVGRCATISPPRMTLTLSVTAMISRSLWVIRMTVRPCSFRIEDAEQVVRFLGRQHPGRLVEDQDIGATKERLQDLDPLLDADRQIADPGVGIDVERL